MTCIFVNVVFTKYVIVLRKPMWHIKGWDIAIVSNKQLFKNGFQISR